MNILLIFAVLFGLVFLIGATKNNEDYTSIRHIAKNVSQNRHFNLPAQRRYMMGHISQNRHFNLPAQRRYMMGHVSQNRHFNLPAQQQRILNQIQTNQAGNLRPLQSLSLGNALSTPGIVPGSAISNLQNQYVNIFSPYPRNQASGQTQMRQHLYGSSGVPGSGIGLGQTGWNYGMSGMPGYGRHP